MRKRKGRNRRRKVKQYRRSTLILLLSVIYCIVFVAPIFISQFSELSVSASVVATQASIDGLSTFIQIFCLLFGLTLFRFVWVLMWPLLCIFTATNNYMFNTFHTQVSKYAIAVMLEPKAREAESLITADLFIMLTLGVLLGIFGVLLLRRAKVEVQNRKMALLALAMAVGLITINQGSMSPPYPPYNFLTSTYQFAYERFLLTPDERRDIAQDGATIETSATNPLVVVVVLGESARGDHFSINGYERETTPLLEKRQNLINFKNTISCGVWTRVAVPCLMTRATISDMSLMYTETSFISVFKKLGFRTSWLSTQGKTAIHYPVTPIAYEADEHIMLEEQQVLDNTIKDEQLLPLLEKRLKEQDKPLLIVLHTYGSHWQYSARYTKDFERYKPVCETTLSRNYDENTQLGEIKDCYTDTQALINSYDNSILYTDYVLDEVIKRLEGKNALFVFTSDHGESLGERGRFLHGHDSAMENRSVPMFWWASDSYIAENPNRWQALVKKSTEGSTHDVIFHSVLGCAGVKSTLVDDALNLCHSDTPLPAVEESQAATEPAAVTQEPSATAPAEKETDTNSETTPPDDEVEEKPVEEKEDSNAESEAVKTVDSYLKRSLKKQAMRQPSTYAMDERLLLELMK